MRLVRSLREKTGPDRSVTCHARSLSPMSVPQGKSQEVWAPHTQDMEPHTSKFGLSATTYRAAWTWKGASLTTMPFWIADAYISYRAEHDRLPTHQSTLQCTHHSMRPRGCQAAQTSHAPKSLKKGRKAASAERVELLQLREVSMGRNGIRGEVAQPHLLSAGPQSCVSGCHLFAAVTNVTYSSPEGER